MKLRVAIFSLMFLFSTVSIHAEDTEEHGAGAGGRQESVGDARSVSKANKCYLGRPGDNSVASGPSSAKSGAGPSAAGGVGQVDLTKIAKCNSCHGMDPKAPASTSASAAAAAVQNGSMPKGSKLSEAEKQAIIATLK